MNILLQRVWVIIVANSSTLKHFSSGKIYLFYIYKYNLIFKILVNKNIFLIQILALVFSYLKLALNAILGNILFISNWVKMISMWFSLLLAFLITILVIP